MDNPERKREKWTGPTFETPPAGGFYSTYIISKVNASQADLTKRGYKPSRLPPSINTRDSNFEVSE